MSPELKLSLGRTDTGLVIATPEGRLACDPLKWLRDLVAKALRDGDLFVLFNLLGAELGLSDEDWLKIYEHTMLHRAGIPIPAGFVVPDAYKQVIDRHCRRVASQGLDRFSSTDLNHALSLRDPLQSAGLVTPTVVELEWILISAPVL